MKTHPIIITLFVVLAGTVFASCPVEDLAKAAAAQTKAKRASGTDAFIKAIETEKSLGAEQQLHLLWLAYDLAETPEQYTRILRLAGNVNSNMARPLILAFRPDKSMRGLVLETLKQSNKLLLGDKQPSKNGGINSSVSIYGSNPYDARYDYDKWEDPHGFIGRYVDAEKKLRADVIANPMNNFHARLWIGNAETPVEMVGFADSAGKLRFIGPGAEAVLTAWGNMEIKTPQHSLLKRIPVGKVCGKSAPEGAVILLGNHSKDLSGFAPLSGKEGIWELRDDGVLEVMPPKAGSLLTADNYTDMQLHIEFRVPYNAEVLDQLRGNSGIIICKLYEVQILDSFGLDPKNNRAGGIYQISAPATNMAAPPLEWQSYLIDFTAPRYDSEGKKTSNARITLWHNGVKIQDNVEIPARTADLKPDFMEGPAPTLFQDHYNRIQFRNIWILPKTN